MPIYEYRCVQDDERNKRNYERKRHKGHLIVIKFIKKHFTFTLNVAVCVQGHTGPRGEDLRRGV